MVAADVTDQPSDHVIPSPLIERYHNRERPSRR
jgi:hypothetical protein